MCVCLCVCARVCVCVCVFVCVCMRACVRARSDLEAALLVADALHVFGQLVQRVDFDCGVGLLRHAAGEVHHAPVANIERVVRERHEPRDALDPEMVARLRQAYHEYSLAPFMQIWQSIGCYFQKIHVSIFPIT